MSDFRSDQTTGAQTRSIGQADLDARYKAAHASHLGRPGSRANTISKSAPPHIILRNTYLLLALSMLPTVFGAWLGVNGMAGATELVPAASCIALLALIVSLMYFSQDFRRHCVGVFLLLSFMFIVGVLLSGPISLVLNFPHGSALIMLAFGSTAALFAYNAVIATLHPRSIEHWSWQLYGSLIFLALTLVAYHFLRLPPRLFSRTLIPIVVFSSHALIQTQRIVDGKETNYVTATLKIYLDLVTVFATLSVVLAAGRGTRDYNRMPRDSIDR